MARASGSTVYVATPVYRGTRFVAETLRSVLGQTHRDLRVMISVDGNDTDSAAACEPFLADPRVRMVVHPKRLGWLGNMNWLIEACDGDFFTYWQQDDVCAPEYLEKLVAALARQPDAVAAYSDLRRFEESSDQVVSPSIVGFTQQRILAAIEVLHWLPLRALVTADGLRRAGPVRGLEDSIAFSDYLWVLSLAVAGDLVRVPEVLYFKRHHRASTSHNPSGDFHRTAREAWIMLGLQIFAEVSPRFEERDRPRLAAVIGDRLAWPKPGLWRHYDAAAVSAAEQGLLALDFYRALEGRFGVKPPDAATIGAGDGPAADRDRLLETVRLGGPLTIDLSASGWPAALLLDGWSWPESWGTWTDGRTARLWLPLPADGAPWRVRLVGQGFVGHRGAGAQPRVVVSLDGRQLLDHVLVEDGTIPPFEVSPALDVPGGVALDLDMPNAVSPADLGLSDDPRRLTLGLEKVELSRAEPAG